MGRWASVGEFTRFTGFRSRSSLTSGIVACLLASFFCSFLHAQATGSISGTVSDATGSAVRGATVTVKAPATGLSRSATTDEKGEYVVPLLGVANYDVRVELQGFQTSEASGIRVQVDEHRQ